MSHLPLWTLHASLLNKAEYFIVNHDDPEMLLVRIGDGYIEVEVPGSSPVSWVPGSTIHLVLRALGGTPRYEFIGLPKNALKWAYQVQNKLASLTPHLQWKWPPNDPINDHSSTLVTGSLFVGGTVSLAQIKANTITADKIVAHSITEDQLATDHMQEGEGGWVSASLEYTVPEGAEFIMPSDLYAEMAKSLTKKHIAKSKTFNLDDPFQAKLSLLDPEAWVGLLAGLSVGIVAPDTGVLKKLMIATDPKKANGFIVTDGYEKWSCTVATMFELAYGVDDPIGWAVQHMSAAQFEHLESGCKVFVKMPSGSSCGFTLTVCLDMHTVKTNWTGLTFSHQAWLNLKEAAHG